MKITEILPSKVDIKYDYVKIDGIYICTITIIKYDTNIQILKTMQDLIGKGEVEISFHVNRENNSEILKKLTNIIVESSSEIGSISKNQIDINMINNIRNKASEIRKRIQIDNEQIYKLSTYVVIKEKNLNGLINMQKRYINNLFANQIVAKPSNFRQREAYIATLPMLSNNMLISKYTYNIFTEKGIAKLFPFFETDIINQNGILLGKTNNNLCTIDLFSTTNNNYNMCIFGSSGAGKSYFVKLMIIKNAYNGVRQIIVDPEGEYSELIKSLGGKVYNFDDYNPFEIDEAFLTNDNFFELKVEQILEYIGMKIKIVDKDKLRRYIVKTYNQFGVNESKDSLYSNNDNNKIYFKPTYIKIFPNIRDLIELMKRENFEEIYEFEESFKTYEKSESMNKSTELYSFDLKGKDVDAISKEMKVFIPKIYELLKNKTLVYFDEIWKGIGLGQDRYVIENIYNMFKTLRKKKAGIVAISQDICDLFTLDNGNFGKSILNNANIKVLFKMEWQDIEMFERFLKDAKFAEKVNFLSKGNAKISMNNASFNLEIKATEYEHKLIEGEKYEENISSNE